jgi:hypothetical protein
MAAARSSGKTSTRLAPSYPATRPRNAYDKMKTRKAEMREIWQSRAAKIRRPVITQKPKPDANFHYEISASSLPRSQKPWPEEIEKKEGEMAELVTERYTAHDDHGEVLVAYYPQYLTQSIVSKILAALFLFIGKYPPPEPDQRDLRHTDWKVLCEMCGGRRFVGLYHLCTWFEQAHYDEGPCLSAHAGSTSTKMLSALGEFIHSIEMLTFTLSLLYRALNVVSWTKAIEVVSEVCARHKPSKNVRCGKWDAWTGRAVLANKPTHPHRDLGDWLLGLAVIACFGSFTGGEFVVPGLKVKFPFQPGDVIFIKSSLLTHFVTPWEPANSPDGKRGCRFSIVHFTHQKIVDWAMSDGFAQQSGTRAAHPDQQSPVTATRLQSSISH